jgi:hypothetical protein
VDHSRIDATARAPYLGGCIGASSQWSGTGSHDPRRPTRRFDFRQRRLCPNRGPRRRRSITHHFAAGLACNALNAFDGAGMSDIGGQIARLPLDASHVVVSVGGNDALAESGVIEERTNSMAGALDALAAVRERFQQAYRAMLAQVLERRLPTAICTIYEGRFPEPDLRRRAATALVLINDCIIREAFANDVTLIDLRLICDEDLDFANPIEPSAHGGAKIARAVADFATASTPRVGAIAR